MRRKVSGASSGWRATTASARHRAESTASARLNQRRGLALDRDAPPLPFDRKHDRPHRQRSVLQQCPARVVNRALATADPRHSPPLTGHATAYASY
jgi:hypothetical protein